MGEGAPPRRLSTGKEHAKPPTPAHLCSRRIASSYSNTLTRLSAPRSAALKATRRRLPSASCAAVMGWEADGLNRALQQLWWRAANPSPSPAA